MVCNKIEHKEKLLVPKWDSLDKHVGERKSEQRLKVMDPKWCAHAKNEIVYVLMNQPSIFQQVQGDSEQDNFFEPKFTVRK
jgi:hypothetical protein